MMDARPTDHLRDIAQGRFTPEAQQWLASAVRQTIEDGDPQALSANLGLNECPHGWVVECRRKEWEIRIARCYEMLKASGVDSLWSIATVISKNMKWVGRSNIPELSRLIREAIEIHPTGTKTDTGIYNALVRMGFK